MLLGEKNAAPTPPQATPTFKRVVTVKQQQLLEGITKQKQLTCGVMMVWHWCIVELCCGICGHIIVAVVLLCSIKHVHGLQP